MPESRVSQLGVEVLEATPDSAARASQLAVEVLEATPNAAALVSQFALEVLLLAESGFNQIATVDFPETSPP